MCMKHLLPLLIHEYLHMLRHTQVFTLSENVRTANTVTLVVKT